jgi:nucleoside-triphosphatase
VSSSRRNFKNFLLTGRPGVGKTSIIEAVAREFGDLTGGFTTGEIRERGIRKGFSVTALDGTSAVLAHEDFAGPVRVGKYGVDVPAFERIALPALRDAMSRKRIILMDEIGKMELASPRFSDLVREVLDSSLIVVATVMEKPHQFADEIKRRGDVETLEVTIGNRSALPGKISEMIRRELESGARR